jgi:hypothetical protein
MRGGPIIACNVHEGRGGFAPVKRDVILIRNSQLFTMMICIDLQVYCSMVVGFISFDV